MRKWIPIFMVMLAAFCWGTGGVFTKMIVPFGFSSTDMVFIKSVVALFFWCWLISEKEQNYFVSTNLRI